MTVFHEPNILNTNSDFFRVIPKNLIDKIILFIVNFDEKRGIAPYLAELMEIKSQFNHYSHLLEVDLVGLDSEGINPDAGSISKIYDNLIKTFPRARGLHLDALNETINLPNLQRLRINSVGTGFAENIVRLPVTELRIDCLNGRDVEEYVGDNLWTLKPQLNTLHIRYRDFSWPLGKFAYLEELCLAECTSFTDDCFRGLSKLQRLYIRDMSITDGAFQHMPNLKKLHLDGDINIGDAAIQCLPKLKILNMSEISCYNTLTDNAFINLSKLEELHLPRVYEFFYEHCYLSFKLFKYLPNLKRLHAACSTLMKAELFQVLPPLDVLEVGKGYNDIKPQNNMFSNLIVKKLIVDPYVKLIVDPSVNYITQEDLDCMIANGLEEVSFILDWWAESRFSPITQAKKTFSSKNIIDFLPCFRKHIGMEESDEESDERV
jgi:hypothetical protein